MDTTSKGNVFEDEVFTQLQQELKNDALGISPATAKIFKKRKYYSNERESHIVVDISIEVWPPKASNYSILIVCECKDYKGSIPVRSIEEFKAKLDQIAGKNIKAIFASRSALQKRAFNYAKSLGIGVIRILPDNQIDWVFYHGAFDNMNEHFSTIAAITNPHFRGENRSFYCNYKEFMFRDWFSLLFHCMGKNHE